MKILIDVDSTIADITPVWLGFYNADYQDNLTAEGIKTWDAHLYVKHECGKKIYEYLSRPDFYDSVAPIGAAFSGVKTLMKRGHEIAYVTANKHPKIADWLFKWGFADNGVPPVIVAKDKSVVPGDIIVDDKPENVNTFPGCGILFDQPWNRDSELYGYRAWNWLEVVDLVDQLSQEKTSRPAPSPTVLIPGLSKDTEIITNAAGGKQSRLDYRFDLVDPLVMFNLANVLATGAESHGTNNWRKLTVEENLNHALTHIYAFMAGDEQDDHLGHAFCRLMMALSRHTTPDEVFARKEGGV